ncbi:universal stress protein [Pseudonocardia sp.]|uniref:universal stress protein n=1 Tax=Pseudonocardia sp. TaxID=60912 RepID=UPI00262EAD3E|nr:universal stress protein [Pseudonocardia sp.]
MKDPGAHDPAADGRDTTRPPGVVVGTDGTAMALRAVAWAATEARVRGVPLLIVHAAPYASADRAAGHRRVAAILGRAVTVARRREPGIALRTERSDRGPADALVSASRSAELLVVGMLGGHTGDALVSSIAPALTAKARCPVTVVRSDHRLDTHRGPVVIGVEDLAVDSDAVDVAFADAERHGTPLVVVHVRHRSAGEPAGGTAPEAGLRPWAARYPDVPVEFRVAYGGAGDQLLHAASLVKS